MSKLLISTQYHENYGSAEEPYWKAKGGSDYVVKKFKGGMADATQAIMALRDQIESDNDFVREYIIDFRIVADDYLTDFERSQLEYEGKITYPAKELAW